MATARAGPYSRILGTLQTRIWGVARTRWGKVMSARGPGPPPLPYSQQVLDHQAIVHQLLILEHWITNDRWRIDWNESLGRLPGWHSMMSWLISNSQVSEPPPFYGLLFAANDTVIIPDAPSLHFTTAFTFELYVKHTTGTTGGTYQQLLRKFGGPGQRAWAYQFTPENKLYLQTSANGTDIYHWSTTDPVLNDTNWHHYRITFNGTTIACHKDNINVPGTGTVAPSLFVNNLPINVASDEGYGSPLNGTLAQIRLWNIVTASDRFQQLLGPTAGLVTEYPILPGTGQSIEDYSGTGNTGQLGSSPDPDVHDPAWTIPTDNPSYAPFPTVSFLLEANHVPKSLGPAYMPAITPAPPAHEQLTITWDPTCSGPHCAPTDPLRGFLCRTTTPGTLIADARMIPNGIIRSDGTCTIPAMAHSPFWYLVACWFRNAGPPIRFSPVAYKQALTT